MENSSVRLWQPHNFAPYMFYDEKYWTSYEDIHSVTEKVTFLNKKIFRSKLSDEN